MPNGTDQQQQQKKQLSWKDQTKLDLEETRSFIAENDYSGVTFASQSYQVYFESREQEEETRELLESNDALERYYEKNDPKMLETLHQKAFYNFPGKKSERKRLRKLHLEKLGQQGRMESMAQDYRKKMGLPEDMNNEEVLKKKSEVDLAEVDEFCRVYEEGQVPHETIEAVREKVRGMDPVRQDHFTKLIRKRREKELEQRKGSRYFKELELCVNTIEDAGTAEQIKNDYLTKTPWEKLEDFRMQHIQGEKYQKLLNADQEGNDSEQLKKLQTDIVKLTVSNGDYNTYRLKRTIDQDIDSKVIPEEMKQKLLKKYTDGDLNRTCRNFMKSVHYRTEGDKRIPATEEDQKNLEYNTRWCESLLSDKEEDWDFRFEKMTNMIDNIFRERREEIERCDGTFDDKTLMENVIKNRTDSGKLLCISGITQMKDQNALTHSKYFQKLSPKRQEELNKKYDIISHYMLLQGYAFMKFGVNSTNGNLEKYGKRTSEESVKSLYEELKGKRKQLDDFDRPYQIAKEGTKVEEYHGEEAKKSVTRLLNNTSVADQIDGAYTGEAGQKLREAVKKTIRSGRALGSEEELSELEKKHADDPEMLRGIEQIRQNRELVREGKLGEDVLRVLSNDRLMLKGSKTSEGKLYDTLENHKRYKYNSVDKEKSQKLQDDILSEMKETLTYYEGQNVTRQGNGVPIRNAADLVKDNNSKDFVHFKPADQKITTARCYISAAEGMTVEAIKAFNSTLASNKNFQGKFFIKYNGNGHGERDDTIVLYSDGTKDALLKQFLDAFQEKCGKGVLKKDTNLPAARHVREGISIAAGTSLMENMMRGYAALRGQKDVPNPYTGNGVLDADSTKSYNLYISKVLLMSRGVAEERYLKNHPEKEAAPGLKDDEMKGLFTQVYQEFLTASGIDPSTMLEKGSKVPDWAKNEPVA